MRKISVSSSPRVLWRLPLQIEHDVIILSAIIVKIYCCLCSSGMEKRIKKLRTYNPGKNIWLTPSKIVKSRKFWYLLFPNFQSLFVQYVIHFGGEAECRAVRPPKLNLKIKISFFHTTSTQAKYLFLRWLYVELWRLFCHRFMSLKSSFYGNSSIWYNLWKSMVFFFSTVR